ncbi:MAG: endopeptidase La [Lachnospiraceae bacterium]|nr:endopeptidase La [Lachnospiraceae bacterium]
MEDFEQERYDIYPIIALNGTVVFPEMVMQLELADNKDAEAARRALREEHKVFVTLRKEEGDDPIRISDVCEVGTVAEITQILRLPNNQSRVILKGKTRARIVQWFDRPEGPSVEAESIPMAEVEMSSIEEEALFRSLHDTVLRFLNVSTKTQREIRNTLLRIRDLRTLMFQVLILLPIPVRFRQDILESPNELIQYQKICSVLVGEVEVLKIRNEIDAKVQKSIDKNQKEYVLREQIKVIRKELGDDAEDEAEKYRRRTDELEASEEVKKAIYAEIRRFGNMGANNSEGQVIRNYIETLLSLPWDKGSEEHIDLHNAAEILARDHYGLEKVKDRIMEFLAVKAKTTEADTPILCLVGPPGTGKTSIAKSIAEAMNRKYVRVCLGGVSDEAEIRGHRRTYVASMPGRIIQGLKQAEVNNPLMLLDELDKIGSDYKGDPSAALLEVLDRAQNSRFIDHYIELPVDLSHVVFIATANTTETIPRPLLDRVEVIELNSYTENEKMHIAKEHLIPKQLKNHGLTKKDITFSDAAIHDMIDCYTREAGVRNLERVIGKVCRRLILKNAENGTDENGKVQITKKNLPDYLGIYRYHKENRIKKPQVGIARGLAWTSMGGTTLEIEVNAMRGTGRIEMTGLMGSVMRESATAGLSYIRSVAETYSVPEDYFEKHDIHIHIPEGAVPKDGPSAGITMVTAVLSAVTGIPVDSEVAMTGEVTMRGRVLPIGGLKEKMLAAKKIGISKLLIPLDNKDDVEDISEEIREGMDIHFVNHMDQVLSEAFVR